MAATPGGMDWRSGWVGVVAVNLVVLLAILALFEGLGAFLFHHPFVGPPGYLKGLRHYYISHGRSIIQYRPGFARYDPGLTYTLRPGDFWFGNVEFRVRFRVNSLGVRDDGESLDGPDAVVLGDSFAMGWGVPQEQTFPSLIERRSGMKVLNCGVSSYGTAREMKMLARVDRHRMKYLIIQYCPNDYEENRSLYEHGNHLPIMDRAAYQGVVADHLANSRYFPGKYDAYLIPSLVRHMLKAAFGQGGDGDAAATVPPDEAGLFLNALLSGGIDLRDVKVIVFAINGFNENDRCSAFIHSLRKAVAGRPSLPVGGLVAVDVSGRLRDSDYFLMDDHIRPSGHAVIADEVLAAMTTLAKWRGRK